MSAATDRFERTLRTLAVALVALAAAAPSVAGEPFPKDKFIQRMLVESPPADDGTIVPGWRIGRVYLGMPVADLLKTLGTPDSTYSPNASSNYTWNSGTPRELSVRVVDGRTFEFWTKDAGSSVRLPATQPNAPVIALGSHQLELIVAMGQPQRKSFIKALQHHVYCYVESGVVFELDAASSRVISIGVAAKGGRNIKSVCEAS